MQVRSKIRRLTVNILQIESRTTLNALCRVSRGFYQTFSPLLYARYTFRPQRIDLDEYKPDSRMRWHSANLQYVQEFQIDARLPAIPLLSSLDALDGYSDRFKRRSVKVERQILEMIEQMPYLKSFQQVPPFFFPFSILNPRKLGQLFIQHKVITNDEPKSALPIPSKA